MDSDGPVILPPPDHDDAALLRALVEVPAAARRLYGRGGFEGLEPSALQVLVALHLESDSTVADMVERLALAQPTVSLAVIALRERGLVVERPDPRDGRRRRQTITREGRAAARRFAKEAAARLGSTGP
jgi:DNA-binding MarR family transcriptional regulator